MLGTNTIEVRDAGNTMENECKYSSADVREQLNVIRNELRGELELRNEIEWRNELELRLRREKERDIAEIKAAVEKPRTELIPTSTREAPNQHSGFDYASRILQFLLALVGIAAAGSWTYERTVEPKNPAASTDQARVSYKFVYTPITKTVMKDVVRTVKKPVVRTVMREEKYTVRKPVTTTTLQDEAYTVRRPVFETTTRRETRTVFKPVMETTEREELATVCEPVTRLRPETTSDGWTTLRPVTSVACRTETRKVPEQRLRYVEEKQYRDVPVQSVRYVEEQRVRKVPVEETTYVDEEKTRQVPVETTEFVEEQITEQVPVQVTEYVQQRVPISGDGSSLPADLPPVLPTTSN